MCSISSILTFGPQLNTGRHAYDEFFDREVMPTSVSLLFVLVPLDAIEVKYESYDYQAAWAEGLLAAWSSMVTMKLSCSFNVRFFPYDKHYCPVSFGQWVFNKNHYVISEYICRRIISLVAWK